MKESTLAVGSLGSALVVGVVVFATTNVDDLLVLSAFFADRRLARLWIVAGQYVGIGALVLAGALAALLALAAPEGLIGLLGFVPLVLGISKLVALRHRESPEAQDAAGQSGQGQGRRVAGRGWQSQLFGVAGVTIANGGDNLGVYIPLFASNPGLVPVYVLVFAAMTGVWCLAAHAIVNNALLGSRIQRYGHIVLPLVLIALGLYILSGSIGLLR